MLYLGVLYMRFSVIIPVYNVEQYLSECIDSILKQTYRDFELILVDDGSKDSSGRICDEYELKDKRIIVIHKENGGHTSARMAGLEIAKGGYVCFIDSDDYVRNDFLENYSHIISSYYPEIIAIDGTLFTKDDAQVLVNYTDIGLYSGNELQELKSKLLITKKEKNEEVRRNTILNTLWSKCFKKSDNLGAILAETDDIKIGEDMFCVLRMIKGCNTLYVSKYNGYYYRNNPNSISHMKANDCADIVTLVNKLDQYFPEFYDEISGYFRDRIGAYIQCMVQGRSCREYVELMRTSLDVGLMNRINNVDEKLCGLKVKLIYFLIGRKAWRCIWLLIYFKNKLRRR